eukprot:2332707-Ditylum_brightwellii.AAC.1
MEDYAVQTDGSTCGAEDCNDSPMRRANAMGFELCVSARCSVRLYNGFVFSAAVACICLRDAEAALKKS